LYLLYTVCWIPWETAVPWKCSFVFYIAKYIARSISINIKKDKDVNIHEYGTRKYI
jgi:hypothetical protein